MHLYRRQRVSVCGRPMVWHNKQWVCCRLLGRWAVRPGVYRLYTWTTSHIHNMHIPLHKFNSFYPSYTLLFAYSCFFFFQPLSYYLTPNFCLSIHFFCTTLSQSLLFHPTYFTFLSFFDMSVIFVIVPFFFSLSLCLSCSLDGKSRYERRTEREGVVMTSKEGNKGDMEKYKMPYLEPFYNSKNN